MRLTKALFSLLLFVAVFVFYQFKLSDLPPPGKFFNPQYGFWQNAENNNRYADELMQLDGLTASVNVLYDERMVPHLFAQNDHDLYFMQGYVTASMRLWQMEMQTHAAAGRLSEIVGEKALPRDREARRIGLAYGAEKALEMAMKNDTSRMMLEAYANGVNAYIQSLNSKELPLEYKLLDYKPESWSPLKTALLLKYMGNMLTGYDQDFEMNNVLKLYGEDVINQLFPDYPDTLLDPVIPKGTPYTKNFSTDLKGEKLNKDLEIISAQQLLKPEPGNGSNNWAVAAEKTADGRPLLCNDPHLSLNLPSIWFEIQLHAPGLNVYGASLPGAPGVIIGFNDSIAWGVTNGAIDVRDWYRLEIKDNKQQQYLYDGAWRDFDYRVEEIRIRGGMTYYDTVRFTHFGPVVYDAAFRSGKEKMNLALRWTLHDPSNESITFYKLNRSNNFNAYIDALRHYDCPGQNFVFASYNNDIAIRQQGKFPVKQEGQGKILMQADDPSQHWQGYIPFNDIPFVHNPAQNFVSSANQHPTDRSYPYYYNGVFEYYRNRRINQQLGEMNGIKLEDMMRLQNDNFNLYASETLPYMLPYLDPSVFDKAQTEAFNTIKAWVYFNDPELTAPAYYDAWWEAFESLLWDEFEPTPERSMKKPSLFHTMRYLQSNPEGVFTDRANTPEQERMADIIKLSFLSAVSTIETWKKENNKSLTWANFKNTSIQHLSMQRAFSVEGVENGGGYSIVNATSSRKGPSWRMIVSPGKPVIAYGIYPGGQSGNPGSRYYANSIDDWAKGKYYSLIMLESDDQTSGILFKQQAKP
jgi:penicillin amidase